jgi:hypothetical protein
MSIGVVDKNVLLSLFSQICGLEGMFCHKIATIAMQTTHKPVILG